MNETNTIGSGLVDVQCKNLLSGARMLIEVLNQTLPEKILETKISAKSNDNFNLLKRIERTTDQYIKRTKNLFYIGFLGHYSSGKSSTINSLLNLKGSKDERDVNNNPTDDQMTLITSLDNGPQVIKLIRSGRVPVVISLIDGIDFLKDKVVLDTPGSGDPSTYEELVRDSLPLCDLIVYCISAANPLNNSDIPLLREKEKNLRDIPTIYVVTRGNEFKVNQLKILDDKNFDVPSSTRFLSELASRMKEIVNTVDLTYEDFVVIDNVDSFQLEKLSERILTYSDSANIIKLHGHKIDFFERTLNSIKQYFLQSISEKLLTIESLLTQAQNNIDEYDRTIIISSDKMINSWRLHDERLKQVLDGSINYNNQVSLLINTGNRFEDIEIVNDWQMSTFAKLNSENNKFTENALLKIKSTLYDIKQDVKNRLFSIIDLNGEVNKQETQVFLVDALMEKSILSDLPSYEYLNQYEDFYRRVFKYLNEDRYEGLKKQISAIQFRISGRNPVEAISKITNEAKVTLAEIFSSYNDAVRMYSVAAFSKEARDYIRKLGLSEKLDQLDVDLPDSELFLYNAEIQIFEAYENEVKKFDQACGEIDITLNDMSISPPILNNHENEDAVQQIKINFSQSVGYEFNELQEVFNKKIIEFFLKIISEVDIDLMSRKIEKVKEIDALKNRRVKFYLKTSIPALILIALTIVFFIIIPSNKIPPSLDVGWQWILGVVSNLTISIASIFYATLRDKYPRSISEVSNKYNEVEKKVISDLIESKYFLFESELSDIMKIKVFSILNNAVSNDIEKLKSGEFNPFLRDLYNEIVNKEKLLQQILHKYSEILLQLKLVLSGVLTNVQKNKDVLINQSILIKESSINPSFSLLDDTKRDISLVRDKISAVTFHSK